MEVRAVEGEAERRACHPVMQQLRPDHDLPRFLAQVRRQEQEGYRLAAVFDGEEVAAVAGYRLCENLAWGRFLYVDDLVTDEARRSRGAGGLLLGWLAQTARAAGCAELHLDSGVQRFGAHRFYLRAGMAITSHHFQLSLQGTDPGP
jgi:GNAT superfamily N-acetyltransferase